MLISLSAASAGVVVGECQFGPITPPKSNAKGRRVFPGGRVAKIIVVVTVMQLLIAGIPLLVAKRYLALSDRTITRLSYSAVALSVLWYGLTATMKKKPPRQLETAAILALRPLVYGSLYVALNTRGWRDAQSLALLGAAFAPPVINAFATAVKGENSR